MQSRSIPAATKAERKRMQAIVELGCVACRSNAQLVQLHPIEVHHLLDCGRRRGHKFTIALCSWHHRGDPMWPECTVSEMTKMHGPSLYHDGKAFKALYGNDESLLSFQEFLLEHGVQS